MHQVLPIESPRPYGSYFDELADALGTALEAVGVGFRDAIERVVVDRGELTFHVRRERLPRSPITSAKRTGMAAVWSPHRARRS